MYGLSILDYRPLNPTKYLHPRFLNIQIKHILRVCFLTHIHMINHISGYDWLELTDIHKTSGLRLGILAAGFLVMCYFIFSYISLRFFGFLANLITPPPHTD